MLRGDHRSHTPLQESGDAMDTEWTSKRVREAQVEPGGHGRVGPNPQWMCGETHGVLPHNGTLLSPEKAGTPTLHRHLEDITHADSPDPGAHSHQAPVKPRRAGTTGKGGVVSDGAGDGGAGCGWQRVTQQHQQHTVHQRGGTAATLLRPGTTHRQELGWCIPEPATGH